MKCEKHIWGNKLKNIWIFFSFLSLVWLSLIFSGLPCFAAESANSHVPFYQNENPLWGLELSGSLNAFAGGTLISTLGLDKVRSASLEFEFQPPFVQKIGVIALGPSFQLYPSGSLANIWSVGGQVHYQARFFREQPLVPLMGYRLEYWNYRSSTISPSHFIAQGPFFGALFLLNVLEPESASEFFINFGILRSYLVAELRYLTGNDNQISLDGKSYYFGLRFEF